MSELPTRVLRRSKAALETRLGVRITRSAPDPHFYAELGRLRTWTPADVVMDVGANDGRTVLRLQDALPSPRIFAFEPVRATHETLVERTKHLPNVRAFHLALGAEPGTATMHLHDLSELNSLSPGPRASGRTETVEVSTIDTEMHKHGLERVHFLKIDTEGHELQVLQGASAALDDGRVEIVQAEVGFGQEGRGFPTLDEVRRFLAPFGYLLHGMYNQCHYRQDGSGVPILSYCDAVFVRS